MHMGVVRTREIPEFPTTRTLSAVYWGKRFNIRFIGYRLGHILLKMPQKPLVSLLLRANAASIILLTSRIQHGTRKIPLNFNYTKSSYILMEAILYLQSCLIDLLSILEISDHWWLVFGKTSTDVGKLVLTERNKRKV